MALDPELVRCAEEDPARPVNVVVVLVRPDLPEQGRTREQLIADRRAAFEEVSAGVRRLIRRLGGQVTDEAWLSSSLRATLPAGAVGAVGAADRVRGVDVPSPLRREARAEGSGGAEPSPSQVTRS